jgi:hypothetical protein
MLSSCFFYLGTRYRREGRPFAQSGLYRWIIRPQNSLDRRPLGPRADLDLMEKISLPLKEI